MDNLAAAIMEMFGRVVASLGTMWVGIGTPNLASSGGASAVTGVAPDAGNITTVLGYVTWVGFAVAILALFMLGASLAIAMRRGQGAVAVGKLGLVLGAVVLLSAASAIVAGALADRPTGGGTGTVAFLQSALWGYMGAAAVLSVIVGAIRMMWEQRAQPGKDLLRSLGTLIVVAGSSVTVVALLVTAADSFSIWIINRSLDCDVRDGNACFGQSVLQLLALSTDGPSPGMGAMLLIVLGLMASLASIVQILLMVARTGMLVILTGILPLAASATNTEMGRSWFRKALAWLVAFILYKPAAAIVYATAFQLTGSDLYTDDGSGIMPVLAGLMLMVLALFALPALMRFVTPLVGAMAAGGAGAAVAMGAMAALPTGAAAVSRLASGAMNSGGGGSAGPPGPAGPSSAPSGSTPTGGGGGSSSPVLTGGGSAAGGSAASGAAASAGAAAGPVGVAAGAAANVVKAGGQAAMGAARAAAESSTGEGNPSGNR